MLPPRSKPCRTNASTCASGHAVIPHQGQPSLWRCSGGRVQTRWRSRSRFAICCRAFRASCLRPCALSPRMTARRPLSRASRTCRRLCTLLSCCFFFFLWFMFLFCFFFFFFLFRLHVLSTFPALSYPHS